MDKNHQTNEDIKSFSSSFINSYFQEIIRAVVLLDKQALGKMIELVAQAYRNDKHIYIIGNGGSASTASHMACDLGKGALTDINDLKEKRLRVISLTDNVALISAYANDTSYEEIFVQQLRNFLEKDDLIIAISGSGNSKNVLNAVLYAKKIGAKVVGLSGFHTGGKLAEMANLSIIVDSNYYGPIEDIHGMIGHLVAAALGSIKSKEQTNGKVKINKATPFFIE